MPFWNNKTKKSIDLKHQNDILIGRNKNLQNKYDKLAREHNNLLKKLKSELNQPLKPVNKISKDRIREFVTLMLKNPEVNIGFMPDIAELKLYENVLTMILNILNETISSSSIKLFGHQIKFSLESEQSERQQSEKKN
jgi:hypothetical protein